MSRTYWLQRLRRRVPLAGRVAGAAAALCAVFILGVFVGQGRISFQFAQSADAGLPNTLDYSSVTAVYRTLKDNYNGHLTATQLTDGLKKGLAEATNDPYTVYFTASEAKQFEQELNNSFSGIGAELGKDDSGDVIIVAPIKGFPADKAGLLPGDVITSINGQSAAAMAPDVAASDIRGPKGTQVTLKVVRNKTENLAFTITRDDIQLPSVTSKILTGGIGYLQISSFSDDTAHLATAAAQQLTQAGAKKLIVDLRNNPGGLLTAAVDVASLWIPAGQTVVTEKGTIGTQAYTATGNALFQGLPTVVLINSGSASASEILAGALHDQAHAELVGTQSFGKGIVQQLIQFADGSELKVTVASWYRPNGANINKKGITPDETVALSDADQKAGNDPQLAAAEAWLGK